MKFATLEKFRCVCGRGAFSEKLIEEVFERLVAKYSEEHRKYHNLVHVEKMLGEKNRLSPDDDALELAIWFHDVIYDPKSAENERLSADYFLSELGSCFQLDFSAEVEGLIMATDHRVDRAGTEREDLLIDIDLSILAASEEDYDLYAKAIREEYSFVPDKDFKEGRSKVLRAFLEKRIFFTEHYRELEECARRNLLREISVLEANSATLTDGME